MSRYTSLLLRLFKGYQLFFFFFSLSFLWFDFHTTLCEDLAVLKKNDNTVLDFLSSGKFTVARLYNYLNSAYVRALIIPYHFFYPLCKGLVCCILLCLWAYDVSNISFCFFSSLYKNNVYGFLLCRFFFFLFPLLSEFNTPHFIAVFLFSDYLPYLDGDGSGLADYMQLGIWVWGDMHGNIVLQSV